MRKKLEAAKAVISELQDKYEGLKILLYNNVGRNCYEIIVDVEKYGLDDEFEEDLHTILYEKMNLKGLRIYTYFVDDFDERKSKQESMKIRLKIWSFFRPVITLIWPFRERLINWSAKWREY